jgi:hypothetical protein
MKPILFAAPQPKPGAVPSPENRPCLQRPAGFAQLSAAETWRTRQLRHSVLLHCGDGAARPMGLTQKHEDFEKALATRG